MNATPSASANKHREGQAAGGAIDRLRLETSVAHSRLDEKLQLIDRLSAPGQRGHLLAGFHLFHRETEAQIAPFLSEIADLDFSSRRRSPLIAEDLGNSGQHVFAESPTHLEILTRAAAFGAFYVLEGSSLGGSVILKQLKLRRASLAALRFLNPYGSDTGPRWRSFLAVLEREVSSGEQKSDAAQGALDTFAFAELCLCKENTN